MSQLWSSEDAISATGGVSKTPWSASGVSIDTRSLQPGDLFVALSDVRDGHDFVGQALDLGAAAAMVDRVPDGVSPDAPLLIVDDVLQALGDLGRAARARTGAKVVAVTGSVGKTSTKEMLRTVLSAQGRTHAAVASYNNHWGVPLTLARMPADTEFAIIEIGMNHPGEISPLAQMARPDVAVVTTVAAVHLAAFDDVQGIAREKAAIFDGLDVGGQAVINADLPVTPILLAAAKEKGAHIQTFGASADARHHLTRTTVGDDTTVMQATIDGTDLLFKIMVPGRHFANNALAALTAVHALGGDLTLAAVDIARWVPPAGRGTKEQIALDAVEDRLTVTLIDDAFNANPSSMAAAIEVLSTSAPQDQIGRVSNGRRIAILGDMLELGPQEIQLHHDILQMTGFDSIDSVHCVGPLMKTLYDDIPPHQRGEWHPTAQAMVERVRHLIDAGDVILVKGSKGIKVSLVVDAIRKLGQSQAL